MTEEKIKYADRITAAKKKWDESSPDLKKAWWIAASARVAGFLLWWDTLKAIEKKLNIDVMGIAREMRWKHAFEHGQRLAKNYKEHGIKEFYDAFGANYEGVCEKEYFEFNDNCYYMWIHRCPPLQILRELGRTEEEIKEMAPLYCLADQAIITGFNPKFEVYAQPRLLMKGDTHCTYRIEDHGGK